MNKILSLAQNYFQNIFIQFYYFKEEKNPELIPQETTCQEIMIHQNFITIKIPNFIEQINIILSINTLMVGQYLLLYRSGDLHTVTVGQQLLIYLSGDLHIITEGQYLLIYCSGRSGNLLIQNPLFEFVILNEEKRQSSYMSIHS